MLCLPGNLTAWPTWWPRPEIFPGTVEKPLHLVLPDKTLYLLVKTTALRDEAGQDLGLVLVFEDLTELERAQRLAAWREVARRIAHEVKNP